MIIGTSAAAESASFAGEHGRQAWGGQPRLADDNIDQSAEAELRAQLEKSEAARKKLREHLAQYKEHALNAQQLFKKHEQLLIEQQAAANKLKGETEARERAERALAAITASHTDRLADIEKQLRSACVAREAAEQQVAALVSQHQAQGTQQLAAERQARQEAEHRAAAAEQHVVDALTANEILNTNVSAERDARQDAERRLAEALAARSTLSSKLNAEQTAREGAERHAYQGEALAATAARTSANNNNNNDNNNHSSGSLGRVQTQATASLTPTASASAATTIALGRRKASRTVGLANSFPSRQSLLITECDGAGPSCGSSGQAEADAELESNRQQLLDLRRQVAALAQERDAAKLNSSRLAAQLCQATVGASSLGAPQAVAAVTEAAACGRDEVAAMLHAKVQRTEAAIADAVAAERERGITATRAATEAMERQLACAMEELHAAESEVSSLRLEVQHMRLQLSDLQRIGVREQDLQRIEGTATALNASLTALNQSTETPFTPNIVTAAERAAVASRHEVDELRRTMNALYGSLYGEVLQMRTMVHQELVNCGGALISTRQAQHPRSASIGDGTLGPPLGPETAPPSGQHPHHLLQPPGHDDMARPHHQGGHKATHVEVAAATAGKTGVVLNKTVPAGAVATAARLSLSSAGASRSSGQAPSGTHQHPVGCDGSAADGVPRRVGCGGGADSEEDSGSPRQHHSGGCPLQSDDDATYAGLLDVQQHGRLHKRQRLDSPPCLPMHPSPALMHGGMPLPAKRLQQLPAIGTGILSSLQRSDQRSRTVLQAQPCPGPQAGSPGFATTAPEAALAVPPHSTQAVRQAVSTPDVLAVLAPAPHGNGMRRRRGRPVKSRHASEFLEPILHTTQRVTARTITAVARKMVAALSIGSLPLQGVVAALDSAVLACASPRVDAAQLLTAGAQAPTSALAGWSTEEARQRNSLHWLCATAIELDTLLLASSGGTAAPGTALTPAFGGATPATSAAPASNCFSAGGAMGTCSQPVSAQLMEMMRARASCQWHVCREPDRLLATSTALHTASCSDPPAAGAPTLTEKCAAAAAFADCCLALGDTTAFHSFLLDVVLCLSDYPSHHADHHMAEAPSEPLMLLLCSLATWPAALHQHVQRNSDDGIARDLDDNSDDDADMALAEDPIGIVLCKVLQVACSGITSVSPAPLSSALNSRAVPGPSWQLSSDPAADEAPIAGAALARLSELGAAHWGWRQQPALLAAQLPALLGQLQFCLQSLTCAAAAAAADRAMAAPPGAAVALMADVGLEPNGVSEQPAPSSALAQDQAHRLTEAAIVACKFLGPEATYEQAIQPIFAWLRPGSTVDPVRCTGVLSHLSCTVLGPSAASSPAARNALVTISQRLGRLFAGPALRRNGRSNSCSSNAAVATAALSAATRCLAASCMTTGSGCCSWKETNGSGDEAALAAARRAVLTTLRSACTAGLAAGVEPDVQMLLERLGVTTPTCHS